MSIPAKLPQSPTSERLASLDAYRGFVMLAMASGGLALESIWRNHSEAILSAGGSESLWTMLVYQFSHAAWVGGGFWDMIQPSFMFMVGMAMPYSFNSRKEKGQNNARRGFHVLGRSLVLILLGIFLSSNGRAMTNFTFVNVLTQIGLGYTFVYLLVERKLAIQLAALAVILGGYWFWFYQYEIPTEEQTKVELAVADLAEQGKLRLDREPIPYEGLPGHWNKHTNAAAGFDRWFLNLFPRETQHEHTELQEQKFWINDGGYQTLNFIPSMATMIFGLIAAQILIALDEPGRKLKLLLVWALACFVVSMGLDTKVWPIHIAGCDWSFCPTVKRIWTPTWAIYSSGWCFLMMAGFYLLFDILPFKKCAFPLSIVGMNSIAFYVMAQLIKNWVGRSFKTHLGTVDAAFETTIVDKIFGKGIYTPMYQSLLILFGLWLIALWMYRRKLFIRI